MAGGASLWATFRAKAFTVQRLEAHLARSCVDKGLRRVLGAFDLVMLGVGGIIGAGVFVLTGEAAHTYAGPAVIISYFIAALAAVFSALCYAEFAVDLPVAGSAYNFISLAFGEFFAWVAAMNLFLEYALISSTVAKGFTGYFATLFGWPSEVLVHTVEGTHGLIIIDVVAFCLTLILAIILALGIKESTTFNNIVTTVNLASIVFVLGMAAPYFKTDNLVPFVPHNMGVRGIFRAASIVFFSYIGFDGVCTAAEEAKNPTRDLPKGIVWSVFISAGLYILMALGITGMKKYPLIDIDAPFSVAFNGVGLKWAGSIVSAGALMGIITSLFLTMLAMTRIFMVLGHEKMLPSWIAKVNARLRTPVNATIVTATVSGVPALLLNIDFLASMVSMGTLCVLAMVCCGSLWRQYFQPGCDIPVAPILTRLLLLVVTAALEGVALELKWPIAVWAAAIGAWLLTALSFYLLPVAYTSPNFSMPFKPITPALGVLLTVHLMSSLGWLSYVLFAMWQAIGVVVYIGYCMHRTPTPSQEREPLLEAGPTGSSEGGTDPNDAPSGDEAL
ncbi:unnamed protein product [Ostreobium quekettii]|uniref:Cationic amino acid transporter C-terminal domain-containing protein n=1 Tax=Ostreobium quekettii TaxID=121088 RepID=A0A8S1ITR8_9CHLO|nr:unnamed protein product [Ostreobium quekettii]|eukprot:evm.model.scf_342.3 EVM.evm.TU.scf_342.3   scf_342:62835-69166(+)